MAQYTILPSHPLVHKKKMRLHHQFLKFALISGTGWILDMLVYTVLVQVLDQNVYIANFCSSYAGLLFVYCTALRYVFRKVHQQKMYFFMLYWIYHFVSISLYSAALQMLSTWLAIHTEMSNNELLAKLFITPANLATNFLFMKLLTLKMRHI